MTRWRTTLKWLHPGMRVKRWVVLGLFGLLVFLIGTGVTTQAHAGSVPLSVRAAKWIIVNVQLGIRPGLLGVFLTFAGAALCFIAFGKLVASLASVLDPELAPGGLVDVVYARRKLSQGRRIVVIGGGTGLSTMLRGLKRYSSNITAIVTVADDGGSSGKLQKQLNILPPGDIRNCLVALADAEPQMMELFQYRFRNNVAAPAPVSNSIGTENGKATAVVHAPATAASNAAHAVHASMGAHSVANAHNGNGVHAPTPPAPAPAPASSYGEGLRDHAFGNLLIAAMCAINGGDFERGVQETARVLNIRGRVLPSTVAHVRLRGEMADGSFLEGETAIADSPLRIKRVSLTPPTAQPPEDVLDAIERADIIVLGPGSVYTSIIPNLLVQGIPEAIRRSKAKKVYACNVMTQRGETDNFTAYDHVEALEVHAGERIFDYVLVNTGQPERDILDKYRKADSVLVEPDTDRIKRAGYRPITGNFVNQTDVVRHDSALLAEAIMRLLD